MGKALTTIYSCICFGLFINAQTNLIPNPGFEEFDKCPKSLADFEGYLKYWKATNSGTPNYYNSCSGSGENGVPNTFFGHRSAYKGSGFVGILTSNTIREYVSIKLKSPLKAGVTYTVSLYSSKVKNPVCISKGIDVVITDAPSIAMNTGGNLVHTPSVTFYPDYTNDSWVYNEMCYRAKGGEQTMILGDFHYPDAMHDCAGNESAYYFIDEVWLYETEDPIQLPLYLKYCDMPFPFKLNAEHVTGITADTAHVIWEWDNVVSAKIKSIEKNGSYKLRANLPGCIVKDYLVNIQNDDCKTSLFVPNVFTPNDDGQNDVWSIHSIGYSIHHISIYNRIGEVVYTSNDKNINWDGESKQNKLPSGVYVYHLNYTNDYTKIRYTKTGSITLLR